MNFDQKKIQICFLFFLVGGWILKKNSNLILRGGGERPGRGSKRILTKKSKLK